MEKSAKQEIFDIMIEGILHQCTLSRVKEGELQARKSNVVISSNGKLNLLYSVPFEFNGEDIHGNARNFLAKEFIEKYSFSYLKNIYDKKMESDAMALKKHLNLEEENKHKLEEIYNELKWLNKYSNSENKGVKWVYSNSGQYHIEFHCKKDQWNTETIEITNNNSYDKFKIHIGMYKEELTHNELINKINELVPGYEAYYQSELKRIQAEKMESRRKRTIINTVEELYNISNTNVILFKNKKSFIGYRKGTRYAVGEGKVGKYYNCDKHQLQKLIITKGITEYCIIDKDKETSGMTNKELLDLSYQSII